MRVTRMNERGLAPKVRFLNLDKDWEKRKLKEVSKYSNGGSFENSVKSEGKYELITLKSVDMAGTLVSSGRFIDDDDIPSLKRGTLVMILSEQSPGLLGMTAQIPKDNTYILNQRVAEILPNDSVNSYFLSLAINRNQQYFSKHGAGTKVQNISKPNVENYEFLCPDIIEQNKISDFFENLVNNINLQQQLLNDHKQLKKAMLQKMFPQNGESVPRVRFSGFTENWKQKQLEEISLITMGQSPNGDNYTDDPSDYILVQGNADMKNGRVVPRVWTTQVTKIAEKGDLILSVRAPVGEIGKTDFNVVLGRGVTGIRGNEFIYQSLIRMKSSGYWKRYSTGSTFESINSRDIKEALILTPSSGEQEKIGNFFKQLDETIVLYEQKLETYQELKKAMLQKMFV